MVLNDKNILSGKYILLISPESWGVNFVSKHHYAVELSKIGNKVYFLNPPSRTNLKSQIDNDLWVVDYKPSFRGLRKFPIYISALLVKLEIKKLEKWLNVRFDIIWNFDSSRFFNLARIKSKLKIAHIVDWTENLNRELLSKTADLNLCTSRYIEDDMKKYNPRTYNIGHGYNPSDYKLSNSEQSLIKDEYDIKAGYVGNLAIKYIDWELLYKLISDNPSIGFYFIGPEGESNISNEPIKNRHYNKIKDFHNVIFLGEIPSKKIPAYLRYFDILLLVYKDRIFRMQLANPHKILEYLGSGKIVVSTYTEEYKCNDGLLEMVDKNSDFEQKFKEVLNNLGFYNSHEMQLKRIQFAMQNSYSEKISLIQELLHFKKNNSKS